MDDGKLQNHYFDYFLHDENNQNNGFCLQILVFMI